MKKLIWAFFAAVALITVACNKEYDDSALKKKVNDLEARVTALEALNTTVSGISDIVTALSEKDYVTGVINVKNSDGEVIGYTITFSKSSPVTIYNGLKGDKGDVGPEGPEGPVGPLPSIGVQLGEDGVYYWVVEGEVIKDSEGNPIPCTQVAPSFKIEEGAWWVSYDGQNWTKLGLISDTGTTVEVDNSNEDYVLLTINGTEVQIPKEKPFTLDIKYDGDLGAVGVDANVTTGLEYEVKGAGESDDVTVDVLSATAGISAKVAKTGRTTGYILITTTDVVEGKIFVYADNNKGKTNIKSITIEKGEISAVADVAQSPSEGGDISLKVNTNISHSVVVPSEINWLHIIRKSKGAAGVYVDYVTLGQITKATEEYEYIITVDANETTGYRFATVSVVGDATGETLESFDIVQKPAEGVTDLYSVTSLPDGTEVAGTGAIVLAASKEGAVISDGEYAIYLESATSLAVGDSLSFTGVKKTNELTGNAYIAEAKAAVEKQGVDVPDMPCIYIYNTLSYTVANTRTYALIQKDEEGYFFFSPESFKVRLEAPLDGLDVESYVGKYAIVSGYVDQAIVDIDWEAMALIYEFRLIANSLKEFSFTETKNWTVSYDGKNDKGHALVSTTVSGGNERFSLKVFTKDEFEAFPVEGTDAGIFGALLAADDVMYYMTKDANKKTKEEIYEERTSAESVTKEFDLKPGEYYAVAGGVDADGNPTGNYSYVQFDVEAADPLQAEYTDDDYVGKLSKEELFGTNWTLYSKPYTSGGFFEERIPCSDAIMEEAEDVEEDSDRITITGFSLGNIEEDAAYFEYYNGVIYSLGKFVNTWSVDGMNLNLVNFSSTTNYYSPGNYSMVGIKVAEGIIAFIDASNNYAYDCFALLNYSDDTFSQPVSWALRYKDVILVDSSIYSDAEKVNAALNRISSNNESMVPYRANAQKVSHRKLNSAAKSEPVSFLERKEASLNR